MLCRRAMKKIGLAKSATVDCSKSGAYVDKPDEANKGKLVLVQGNGAGTPQNQHMDYPPTRRP